ncbi:MAG: helix-turn-helix transcriptional regulator [Pseudomonadota bacterium]
MASYSKQEKLLCKLLRELRIERKMTQIELAKKVRFEQQVVSKIENGHRRLYATQLFQYVSDGFDLSPSEFAAIYEEAERR